MTPVFVIDDFLSELVTHACRAAGLQRATLDAARKVPLRKPLHMHNICQRDFQAVMKRAGLPQVRPCDLRHCHATHLSRQGAPVTVTLGQPGHRSSSTTLRYYVHPMPNLQDEHVGRLAERLMGRRADTDGGSGTAR